MDRLAVSLVAAGVGKGDRVATLCTPSPDYMVAFLATVSIGAIWVGLNPKYARDELAYVLHDSRPRVLLTRTRIGARDYADDLAVLVAGCSSLETVVTLAGDPAIPGAQALSAFLECGERAVDACRRARAEVDAGDACLIVYTSGSTGRPKGAVLHHGGIARFSVEQHRLWPLSTVRVLNYLPVNHVGCVVDVSCPALAHGGCIVFLEKFDAARSLELLQRERITFWGSVPSAFQMQLALPTFGHYDLSAVELIVWEGAAMPEPMIRQLRELCPRLATNYGQTESTSAMTFLPPTDDIDLLGNTVGEPFPGVDIRLIRSDGEEAETGEEGEVQARSYYNMLGYWNRPEATQEVLLEGGWLRTGDVAIRRPDGRFRLVGRLKEMFKSGGYNVYPREIEAALEEHPAVDIAAVVGIPDPLWGEVGVAYVIPKSPVEAGALIAYARERLANYKVPKRFELVDSLPLLPIGKVDKLTLRRLAADLP